MQGEKHSALSGEPRKIDFCEALLSCTAVELERVELPILYHHHRLRNLARDLELFRIVERVFRRIGQQLLQFLVEDLRNEFRRVRHRLALLVHDRHSPESALGGRERLCTGFSRPAVGAPLKLQSSSNTLTGLKASTTLACKT